MDIDDFTPVFPFTQLPKEIRLLVWEATFEPQFILLRFVEGRRPFSTIPAYAFKPYDDPRSPVALKVCQESRQIALQRYKPWIFRWYLHDRVKRSKFIMWDPTCDIVVLPKKFLVYQLDVLKALFYFQLKDLKKLAIPTCFWLIDHRSRAPFSILSIIGKAFPNLDQLIICLGGEADRRDWDHTIPFEPLLRLSPASHVSQHIAHGLECIKKDFPEWPLSTVKVWEAEDDTDTLYSEVFRVLVAPDKLPTYKCWCRSSRWDTSVHDRHGSEGK
jgi:hypothetical protein